MMDAVPCGHDGTRFHRDGALTWEAEREAEREREKLGEGRNKDEKTKEDVVQNRLERDRHKRNGDCEEKRGDREATHEHCERVGKKAGRQTDRQTE